MPILLSSSGKRRLRKSTGAIQFGTTCAECCCIDYLITITIISTDPQCAEGDGNDYHPVVTRGEGCGFANINGSAIINRNCDGPSCWTAGINACGDCPDGPRSPVLTFINSDNGPCPPEAGWVLNPDDPDNFPFDCPDVGDGITITVTCNDMP